AHGCKASRRRGLQKERRAEAGGEISAALRERRNVRDQNTPDELAHPLEIAEKESVVLDDRTADGKAILIAAEDRFVRMVGRGGREHVARVQRFFAQELKDCPVQIFRS